MKQYFLNLYKRFPGTVESEDLTYPWLLYNYAKVSKQVLELGTGWGHSSLALLFGLEESNGHLWSVDILESNMNIAKSLVEEVKLSHLWTPILLDDTRIRWEIGNLDLIYLDTSHQYWHTLYELEYYHRFLKDMGYILCHDVLLQDSGVGLAIVSF